MKLIIDIPEWIYRRIQDIGLSGYPIITDTANAIRHGTPIPDNATVCDIEQIRAKIADLEKKTIEDVCLDECRPCVYTTFEYVRQVIDKYK